MTEWFKLEDRIQELAEFLGGDPEAIGNRLRKGFHHNHSEIAQDYNLDPPKTDDQLLNWYKETNSYLFELSCYHLQPEWAYDKMADGIATHLLTLSKPRVLELGAALGDMCVYLAKRGLKPTYHDLKDSQTAAFAQFLFKRYKVRVPKLMSTDWDFPNTHQTFDAVLALDFFEHLLEDQVELWARKVYKVLNPGGIFLAQNAFGVGVNNLNDGTSSSIPMHEASGSKWVTEWTPMMERTGFTLMDSGWWLKS